VLSINDQLCTGRCGSTEDRDYMFVSCDFYGNIWDLICGWLGFPSTTSLNFLSHPRYFCGVGGSLKSTGLALKMIWLVVVYVI